MIRIINITLEIEKDVNVIKRFNVNRLVTNLIDTKIPNLNYVQKVVVMVAKIIWIVKKGNRIIDLINLEIVVENANN